MFTSVGEEYDAIDQLIDNTGGKDKDTFARAGVLGQCVACWSDRRGDLIMEAFLSALEDANYHGIVTKVVEAFPACKSRGWK